MGGARAAGERERENENELTALAILKEFHGTAKSFAFSELIPDYNFPHRRLPKGL